MGIGNSTLVSGRWSLSLWGAGFAALTLTLLAAARAAEDPPVLGANCPLPPDTAADPGTFGHRWAGLVYSAFTTDGDAVWTGEDGGRIRHRDPQTGTWSFQALPYEVRGLVRAIHFLSNGLDGWAVTSDGWVLGTQDGGAKWEARARIPALPATELIDPDQEWEELFDVWFAENGTDGWLVAEHWILYTTDGGVCWEEAALYVDGQEVNYAWIVIWEVQLYGLDVRIGAQQEPCGGGTPTDFLGLVVGSPGVIFRSVDEGRSWNLVLHSYDVCDLVEDAGCLEDGCPPNWFGLWDVKISRHPSEPLALAVGGVGNQCGIVLVSTDDGCSWGRELHECDVSGSGVDCANDCEYNPPCDPTNPVLGRRHKEFKTLYSVSIFDYDNTAIAAGYNGQHLVRETLSGTGVWRDRSEFGAFEHVTEFGLTIFPLTGTAVPRGQVVPARAWITGAGGHIRRSDDGGQIWDHEVRGEPFRTQDVWFKTDTTGMDHGWQVGQLFRMAFSLDGGLTWTQGEPDRIYGTGDSLHSITFAGDGNQGVTVGGPIPGGTGGTTETGPRILWTADFGDTEWKEPSLVQYDSTSEATAHLTSTLHRVAWGKDLQNLHFWAVGAKGLVLHTTDGGDEWTQVLLDPNLVSNPHAVQLQAVAASSPNAIVTVGSQGTGANQVARAFSYAYQTGTWAEIEIDDQGPGAIVVLTDLTFQGSLLFAVGDRVDQDVKTGVVLRYDTGTGKLVEFPGPLGQDEVPSCADAQFGANDHVLTRVVLAPGGSLWIGGTCGRIWQCPDPQQQPPVWVEHKTQTSADVRGMMFVSAGTAYVVCMGGLGVNQVVVRYQEPE